MSLFAQFRGFIRAFRSGATSPRDGASESLAKTIKESSHVRGGRGGLARASTEQQHKIVVKGHENYTKSFKRKK